SVQAETYADVTTDEGGRFILDEIPVQSVTITVSREGYYPITRKEIPVGTRDLKLVLVKEGTLAGHVVDQFNQPIASANIWLQALQGVWVKNRQTDSTGRFVEEEPPQGPVQIRARMTGYIDQGDGTKQVESPTKEEVVLILKQKAFSLSGKVVNQETKLGTAGFTMLAVPEQSDGEAARKTAQTDANGEYIFHDLKRGTYTICGDAQTNRAGNWVIPEPGSCRKMLVFDGDVKNVDFNVIQGLQVSGRVLTRDNQPVAEAQVTMPKPGAPETTTDQNGHFETIGVPGASLFASHKSYGTGLSDPLPLEPGAKVSDITITLRGPGSIFGTVKNQAGTAVENAKVTLLDLQRGTVLETETNNEGIYSFDEVPIASRGVPEVQSTHTLQVSKEGYSTVTRKVVIYPEEVNTVDLTLEEGGTISGRAADSTQKPLADVVVTALNFGGERIATQTNNLGLFAFKSLPDGWYDLQFRFESSPPLTTTLYRIPTGSTRIDVVLTPGEWAVTGTVTNVETREPCRNFTLSVEGVPVDRQGISFIQAHEFSSPDGGYQLLMTEPAQYRIRYVANGFEPVSRDVTIGPETEPMIQENVELRPLHDTGRISGTFVPPSGMTLARIDVIGISSTATLGNVFLLDNLPVGSHDLLFYVQNDEMLFAKPVGIMPSVDVKKNEDTDLGEFGVEKMTAAYRTR
ncbi:MAG: carboxypeptidase-like regulatory domain-containing protein, partial [bacterium]